MAPPVLVATGLAGAGFARVHSESAWMFAAASALLLAGAFWITVLHHRTTASAVIFLVTATCVSVASAEWFLMAMSAALGVAAVILMIRDRRAKQAPT